MPLSKYVTHDKSKMISIGYSMFCVGYGIYTRERTAISSHQVMGMLSKNVRYGKYTTLNMARFSQLIG